MSVSVFFSFLEGLVNPLTVPLGTLAAILGHVQEIEQMLGLKTTQYKDNAPRWASTKPTTDIRDEPFCLTATRHNEWVRRLYKSFAEWSKKPVIDGEQLTPDDAKRFWHALETIDVPIERWTKDYYRERMAHLYEVMRGRESEGVHWDPKKPLTEQQAAAVIVLFSEYLDVGDQRLDVPNGRDYLASSSDGGYDWCEKCGPMCWDDIGDCRKRGCPLLKEYRAEQRS